MKLFSQKTTTLAGWAHYLCFDMFLGLWVVENARSNNVPHMLIIPSLIFILLAGPLGFVTYMSLRTLHAGPTRPAPPKPRQD